MMFITNIIKGLFQNTFILLKCVLFCYKNMAYLQNNGAQQSFLNQV